MSIHFNWETLTADSEVIEQRICDFLHNQFQAVKLPPFISSLAVSSFKLGSVPPEVTLKHFSDPFPEFYHPDDDSETPECTPEAEPTEIEPGEFDIQSYVELKYAGDMQLAITATLLVNYPTPEFISLPVSIKVTNIDIHSLIVAAFIKPRVYISILNDLDSSNKLSPMEGTNVIKSMKIESEIGDNSEHGAVLRNVTKVEKFVIEQLRNVIREELVWPGWLTLEF